jgi:polysaccharide deacetylase family protein (PEP-CTERM system associated)
VGRGEEHEVVLSFDVEEHHRIEAAAGLDVDPVRKAEYASRVGPAVGWLLDRLGERGIHATFFILGTIARDNPALIRAIRHGGHEVASHGWDHRRIVEMTPDEFRCDLRQSKDALEQAAGEAISGYRAPTFSVVRKTAWAIDVLAEAGFLYDSSIYPVRHDRYGVPDAPRAPFLARGPGGAEVLELPPATLRLPGLNLPAGGGGYFRLFPPAVMEGAIRQARRDYRPAVATLYFHPWEFDPEQPRLPLGRLNRFRTYVGIGRSRGRLAALLGRHPFARAVDVAGRLAARPEGLPRFEVAQAGDRGPTVAGAPEGHES